MIKQDNESKKISFSAIVFIIYSFYYISGYSSKIHNYVIFALFTLWILISSIENKKIFLKSISTKSFIFLLMFLIYYFVTSFFVAPVGYILEYIGVFLFLYSLTFQSRYYIYKRNKYEIKLLISAVIIAFSIFSLNAIRFYIMVPSAARTLASNYYAFDNIAIGGGYSIAFGSSVLFVYFFELIIRKEPIIKRHKLKIMLLLIILGILILKTESTITILSTLIGAIVAILIKLYNGNIGYITKNTNNKKVRKVFTIVILIFTFSFLIFNTQNISFKLINITNDKVDSVVARRINRMAQKIYYTSIGVSYNNYVDIRLNTVKDSWNVFLSHPLLGIGYKCGNIFSELEEHGVGTHSELTDLFAQHGIIGGLFWILFIITAIKNNHSKANSYLVSLLIMMILNPFKTFHGYCVLLFVIPLINYLINNINLEDRNEQ